MLGLAGIEPASTVFVFHVVDRCATRPFVFE